MGLRSVTVMNCYLWRPVHLTCSLSATHLHPDGLDAPTQQALASDRLCSRLGKRQTGRLSGKGAVQSRLPQGAVTPVSIERQMLTITKLNTSIMP